MSLRAEYERHVAGVVCRNEAHKPISWPRTAAVPVALQGDVLNSFSAAAWRLWLERYHRVLIDRKVLGLFRVRLTWGSREVTFIFTLLFGDVRLYIQEEQLREAGVRIEELPTDH